MTRNRIKGFFTKLGPFFAIFFLVFLFFWKFFLKGLIPIPADITVGMYYPWLDYKWGYAVGVPVKNPLLSDTVSQFWIWRNLAIDLFKSGQSPFWNPYALSGSPLVPVFHSAFFSPFNLFFSLFEKSIAMSLIVVFQPLLATLFMYLLLRSLKLSNFSSLFGGIIFGFSGFMLSWLEWGNVGHTLLWLPFFIWTTEKYLLKKNILYLVLLIASLGISLSAGHPQTFFYCFSMWFLYFVWRMWKYRGWKSFFFAILIGGLFCLFFSFLIFPAAESLVNSIRPVENYISQNNYGFFPLFHLITFLAPDFFGNPATGNWWGRGFNYQEQIAYFGLIPLLFALFALFSREKKLFFWKIIFLVSVLLAFRYPFSWLIYLLKLPLLSTASASRILFLSSFSGAVLASFGLEMAKREKKVIPSKLILFLWVFVLGYGIAIGLTYFLVLKEIRTGLYAERGLVILSSLAGEMKVGLRNLVLPSIFLFLISCLAIGYDKFKEKKIFVNIFVLAVIFLTIGELFRFGWKYNPFVKKEMYFPKTSLTTFLKKNAGFQRIERERGEILPPNMWIPYGLYSASGYDPVYPLSYAKFLSILSGQNIEKVDISRYGEIESYKSPFFDLLGIRYIAVITRDERDIISKRGKPSYKFNLDKFKKIYNSGSVAVLENYQAFPRAFFVKNVSFSNDDSITAQKMIENSGRLNEIAFVTSKDKNILETPSIGVKSSIAVETYQSGKVVLSTDSDDKAFLVLMDTFFPGWKAFVDGRQTEIFRANFAFRAVFVPKGQHRVSFVYDPVSFKAGLVVSLISLISLTILVFGLFLRENGVFKVKLPLLKK